MARRRAPARRGAVAIVVLARYPTPGRVKTRLAATIGAARATALYAAFVHDLASRLRPRGARVWWGYTPASAPFGRLVGTSRCFPQRGRDLGVRIDHAIRTVARRTGGGPVIALGTDAPHVSLRELARAERALRGGADVVLGPAADGGYYLIGLGTPRRGLFEGIPWSTRDVARATRRRCRALGLTCVEIAPGFDVDDARDLRALARYLRRHPRALRRTRAVLATVTLPAGSLPPGASPSSGCVRR